MYRLFFLLEQKQRFGSRLTTQRGLFGDCFGEGREEGRGRRGGKMGEGKGRGRCVIAMKGRSSVHDDCDAIPYTYQCYSLRS